MTTTIFAAFAVGLLSGLHCAMMCGPLAIALPMPRNQAPGRFAISRLVYNGGRLLTYASLGAIAGLFGSALSLQAVQRPVAVFLGILLFAFALFPAWMNSRLGKGLPVGALWIRVQRWWSPVLDRRTVPAFFVLGGLNGMLPCGMVWFALIGAGAQGQAFAGAGFMLAFGAGTLPVMLATGMLRKVLQPKLRHTLSRLAPIGFAFVAMLLVLRGLGLGVPFLSPGDAPHAHAVPASQPVP